MHGGKSDGKGPDAARRSGFSFGGRLGGKALVLLALVTGFGAFLRFYHIGAESLWYDELFSADVCGYSTLAQAITEGNLKDNNPPVHHVAMFYSMKLFGDNETAARLPSAVAGVLAIVVLFLIGKQLYSAREGLIAAALLAVLWAPVSFSQEARAYSFLLFFSLVSMFLWKLVVDALERGAYNNFLMALYVAAAVVCAYTHYFGVLMVLLQGSALFLLFFRRKGPLLRVALMYLAVLVAVMPWVPVMQNHAAVHRKFWIARPEFLDLAWYMKFAFNDSKFLLLAAVPFFIALGARSLWLFLRRRYASAREFFLSSDVIVLLWLAVPVVLIFAKSLVSQPLFLPRYLIISLPAVYLLFARSITLIPVPVRSQMIIAAFVVGVGAADLVFEKKYYSKPQKQQWREAVQYLIAEDRLPEKSVIAGYNSDFRHYYFRQNCSTRKVLIEAGTAGDIPKFDSFIADTRPKYIWYLYGHINPEKEFLRHLVTHYRVLRIKYFHGTAVCLLENRGARHAALFATPRGRQMCEYLVDRMLD